MAASEHGQADAWAKLWSLVDDIKTGMMTSRDGQHLRSRPMRGHADRDSRELWFFTKSGEIESDHQVNLAYARPDKEEYVSLSGRASLVHDRERVDRLWSPYVAAWFPQGKGDPDLALIRVDVEQAERLGELVQPRLVRGPPRGRLPLPQADGARPPRRDVLHR